MAKGYWMFHVTVNDPDTYQKYIEHDAPVFAKYGGRFLARGGKVEAKEGQPKSRVVVVEFPSYADALNCYHSPEYAAAMKLRQGRSLWDMAITEGYEGPQPTK